MTRFFRDTWLATAAFAGLSRLVSNENLSSGLVYYVGPTVTAVLLVPILWRWFVMPQGRPRVGHAALAGATLAFLIVILSMTMASAWYDAPNLNSGRAYGGGLGDLALAVVAVYTLAAVPIAGALGAGIGVAIALVQRWWTTPVQGSRPAYALSDGAMCGGQIAVLAGPFTATLCAHVLPKSILPMLPGQAVSFPVLTLEAWVLTIPAGAMLGMRWIRRRRRISAVQQGPPTTPGTRPSPSSPGSPRSSTPERAEN